MISAPSPMEIGVVAVIALLLFGSKRLPELGSSIGKAITNFRSSYKNGEKEPSQAPAKLEPAADKAADDQRTR
jgi:sec-independent protein translocase protein TatA